jgi:flagellar biosynthesis protein FlhF
VKLFTADSMQDAMAQVKTNLGRDAVILHTRKYRKGGVLGFFSKEMVEVMAATEDTAISQPGKRSSLIRNEPLRNMEADEPKMTAMQLELSNMRKLLEQVLCKMPKGEPHVSPFMDLLLRNDIDVQIAENLLKGLPDEASLVGMDAGILQQLLMDRMKNYLQKIEGIQIPETGRKVVAFIGPTGVGKTTTIAKLAANFAVKNGFKVALVTADTYRISAVEQLRTYADIMGVPIEIVYSPDELKAALYRHQDKQLVLIDTAGRSPRNHYQLAELQALLQVDPHIETHLVLSTTTKYKDALEVVNRFSMCSPQKFLFTKVDEATNIGTILNLLYHFPLTLSYVTTGQSVPDDIELASTNKLANLILRD